MNLELQEAFEEENGIIARAFAPLQKRMTDDAKKRYQQTDRPWAERLSPWVVRLGKGGLVVNHQTGIEEFHKEISLYRHVMDVSILASYLLLHAINSGKIDCADQNEARNFFECLFLIAFFHDADKYAMSKSSSPSLEDIQTVWNDLNLDHDMWIKQSVWPSFSIQQLHAAVSLVENRGQRQALLSEVIPNRIRQLADMIHEADNFLSRVLANSQYDIRPAEWIISFNKELDKWHRNYGVPLAPWQILTLHDTPAVLHRALEIIMDSELFYPLMVYREGRALTIAVPSDVDKKALMDSTTNYISQLITHPQIMAIPNKSAFVVSNCSTGEELVELVGMNREQKIWKIAAAIKSNDLMSILPYLFSWAKSAPEPQAKIANQKSNSPNMTAFSVEIEYASFAMKRALMLIIAVSDSKDSEALNRLLNMSNPRWDGTVSEKIQRQLPNFAELDGLTQRLVGALEASLQIRDDEIASFIDFIHGKFTSSTSINPEALVESLRLQWDLGKKDSWDLPEEAGFESDHKGGTCLLCGVPTNEKLYTGETLVVGIKASAFNNRVGHKKSIWSQSEKNYLCAACRGREKMHYELAEKSGNQPDKAPMLISTPVRAFWQSPIRKAEVEQIRSIHSEILTKSEEWVEALPWNSDYHLVYPLGFEVSPDLMLPKKGDGKKDNLLNQLYRFTQYAAVSGEPVQLFISHQREKEESFYYEMLPSWIAKLLKINLAEPTQMPANSFSRKNFPELLDRLELLTKLATINTSRGYVTLNDLPVYGWLAGAYAIGIEGDGFSSNTAAKIQMIDSLKEWYPVSLNNELDNLFSAAVNKVLDAQRISLKDSRSKKLLIFNRTMEISQEPQFSNENPLTFAAGRVFNELGRAESYVSFDKVEVACQACYQVVEVAKKKFSTSRKSNILTPKDMRYLREGFEAILTKAILIRIMEYKAKQASKKTSNTEPSSSEQISLVIDQQGGDYIE